MIGVLFDENDKIADFYDFKKICIYEKKKKI